MFKDTWDFVQGVNRAAICSYLTGVQLYSFVLMDNHVHFVCCGTQPACKDFINKYKNLSGKYISAKYGNKRYLKGLDSKIIPILSQESLMETICYIDRNPIAAGFGALPTEYLWGSSRYLFREDGQPSPGNGNTRVSSAIVHQYPQREVQDGRMVPQRNLSNEHDALVMHPYLQRGGQYSGYRKLGDLTVRERWQCLGSRAELPSDWVIDENGMILPWNFLQLREVEVLFKTPNRYLYYLSKKLEGKVDELLSSGHSTFIPDKFLRPIVSRIALEMYGAGDLDSLGVNARMTIARKLRYEYAATVKQISRMLYLNAEVLKGYI